MSLWDRLTGEFIDVIEWTTDDADTMVYRFERHGNEIKYGAKLTVREGQVAVFINEGQLADVFPPGMYMLETNNMPMMTTLNSWSHGFNSPFKAEVYFVATKRFVDMKWGTKNPVMIRDPEFGPVRLRAFGTYGIRVNDAAVFMREIVGTDGQFDTDEIEGQMRNIIVSRFSTAAASSGIPVLDLAANYDQLGDFVQEKIAPEMAEYGLELTKLLVENVSLPPEVEKAMDKRTQMGVLGDLNKYTQFQAAESMRAAAENGGDGGGMAGAGMGAGIGMALGNAMGNAMNTGGVGHAPAAAAAPPPLPTAKWHVGLNGQTSGPHDAAALSGLVSSGQMSGDTLVWCDGMSGWTKASDVGELGSLFPSAPPPLPT